jgi:AcrR family transcriptional regulator
MSDSREQILTIAYHLFLQKSYKEVSIQEIANSVGMTKGAFYYFFESKEQLFQEVFNRFFITRLQTDFSRFSHASLYRFYHDYFEYMIARQPENGNDKEDLAINIYAYIFDAIRHFPGLFVGTKESIQNEKKSWKEIIEIAKEKGEINSPMSNEQIADIFIFTNDGHVVRRIFEGDRAKHEDRLLLLWDAFYAELKG